jgi:hypothetical protein
MLSGLVVALAGCAQSVVTPTPPPAPANPTQLVGIQSAPFAPSAPDPSAAPLELGPTPGDESVSFSVSLRLPGEADLNAYLAGLTQPGSPSYRKYLTADQFGARFGLSDIQIEKVVAWLSAAGLSATAVPQRTSIGAQGTAAQVDQLLGKLLCRGVVEKLSDRVDGFLQRLAQQGDRIGEIAAVFLLA